MKKFALTLFSLLVIAGSAQARLTYDALTPEVRELQMLYADAWISFPTSSFPVAADRLRQYAEELLALTPEGAQKEKIKAYLSSLRRKPGRFDLAAEGALTLEGYVRSAHLWNDGYRDFVALPKMFNVRSSFAWNGNVGVEVEAFFGRRYDRSTQPFWNWPDFFVNMNNPIPIQFYNVHKGVLWAKLAEFFEFEIGRNSLHIGPMESSFYPHKKLPYFDMLRMKIPIKNLKVDWVISTLDNRPGMAGTDFETYSATDGPASPLPQASYEGVIKETVTSGTPDGFGYSNPYGFRFLHNLIFMSVHRVEYDWKYVRAGIGSTVVYVRPQNAFQVTDFLPIMSWHQSDIYPNNINILLDVTGVPAPGLEVMLMAGLDDLNIGDTGLAGDTSVPTIPAVMAGVRYRKGFSWGSLHIYVEGGWTHDLWGGFDNRFKLARHIYRYRAETGNVLMPLTSPYGPGAGWLKADFYVYNFFKAMTLGLKVEYVNLNTWASLVTMDYDNGKTSGGASIYGGPRSNRAAIAVDFAYELFGFWKLYVRPELVIVDTSVAFNFTMGTSLSFDVIVPVHDPKASRAADAPKKPRDEAVKQG